MRFRSLGSGSKGNATLIEAEGLRGRSRLLVDAGFTLRELVLRLAREGLQPESLDAVFITHEHGDHIGCAVTLARRHRVPLWTSRGTWAAVCRPGETEALQAEGLLHFVRDGETIELGALTLRPYTVPHDAAEPLQLCVEAGGRRLGLLTDTGQSTPHLLAALAGCQALLLETNHDPALLAASRYPASLKSRIAGPWGHLANAVAADILGRCAHPGLRHVVAAHLSEQNNQPQLAAEALAAALGCPAGEIVIADAAHGSPWLDLG